MRFGVKMNIVSRQSSSRESKSGAFCHNFFESVRRGRRKLPIGLRTVVTVCWSTRRPAPRSDVNADRRRCSGAVHPVRSQRHGRCSRIEIEKEDTQTKFQRLTMRDEDGERNEKFIDESLQKRTFTWT